MKLYESGEDYLEAVLMLQKKNGMVRSVDLARHMEVSKPSVCHAVATLRDGGFLTMDEDHFLHLTDVGREVAERIYERHCFFTEQLKLLYAELYQTGDRKKCTECGTSFASSSNSVKYCPDCRKRITRRQAAERMRKRRAPVTQ